MHYCSSPDELVTAPLAATSHGLSQGPMPALLSREPGVARVVSVGARAANLPKVPALLRRDGTVRSLSRFSGV